MAVAVRLVLQVRARSALAQGHVQCSRGKRGFQAGPHAPTNEAAAVELALPDDVKPALRRLHVGDICDPDLIGPVRSRSQRELVGNDRLHKAAVGRAHWIPDRIPALKIRLTHKPSDAFA